MRNSLLVLAVLAVLCGGTTALASTVVDLDAVLVTNGLPIFFDDFDNGLLDTPPWFASGGIGPEAGTVLSMSANASVFAELATDPGVDVAATAIMDLSSFPAGSAALLLLLGDGDPLALTVLNTPNAAALYHGAALLGFIPLTDSSIGMTLTSGADGTVTAIVNGAEVFSGPVNFGAVAGVGVAVLPEPATLGLLGIGAFAMAARRWRRGS